MHAGSYIVIPDYNVNPQFPLRSTWICHLAASPTSTSWLRGSSISRNGAPNGFCAPATHVTAVIFTIITLSSAIHGSPIRIFVLAPYCFVLSCLTYRFYEI
ncbi:unnamed protein product [Fusarium venenatum]|uniref:Uncharacterized protein n=1 Tax=Fusarium venenatum TaxID=56646 RepID=A0A2L2TS02_9HYPO|nr:uncharacterized protein FVRRES_07021 [Fusarium venenatum]CEI62585.1 unnamed protein product [Fusarium venenatum]